MACGSSAIARYWPLAVSLLAMSCASTSRVPDFLSREYFTSKDGLVRYRLPLGWLNASDDPPSSSDIIWLVRDDFAATISMKEVVVDEQTRREIDRSGLGRIAELTLALVSGERGVNVVNPPVSGWSHGMRVCRYEYATGSSSDTASVILIDNGEKVYEVRLLMTDKIGSNAAGDVLAVQQHFVDGLSL